VYRTTLNQNKRDLARAEHLTNLAITAQQVEHDQQAVDVAQAQTSKNLSYPPSHVIRRSTIWRDIVPLVLFAIMILITVYARPDYDQISRWPFISLHGSNAGNSSPVAQ
jgi:hypothetical protein